MLKAVLVDLDGTLVDSDGANAAAYAAALSEWGVAVDVPALATQIKGLSWRGFLPPLLAGNVAVDAAAVARRKQEIYPRFFDRLRLNHLLMDLLRVGRRARGTALVTTASRRSGTAILDHFALHDVFDATVFAEDVARLKPDPEAYHVAAAQLGATPAECLVIEDSEVGLAAARAFGGGVLHWTGWP